MSIFRFLLGNVRLGLDHIRQASLEKNTNIWFGHVVLGIIECTPVIGHLTAGIECVTKDIIFKLRLRELDSPPIKNMSKNPHFNPNLLKFFRERGEYLGVECDYIFDSTRDMSIHRKSTIGDRFLIHINFLYLVEEEDINNFIKQSDLKSWHTNDSPSNYLFYIERYVKNKERLGYQKEEMLILAKRFLEWFNTYSCKSVEDTTNNRILALAILVMNYKGKLSALKRFILTHEFAHAHDRVFPKSVGEFDPGEFNFIKLHQHNEVSADLTAARLDNAYEIGIEYFQLSSYLSEQFDFDELDPHPVDKDRVRALKMDYEKSLKAIEA